MKSIIICLIFYFFFFAINLNAAEVAPANVKKVVLNVSFSPNPATGEITLNIESNSKEKFSN